MHVSTETLVDICIIVPPFLSKNHRKPSLVQGKTLSESSILAWVSPEELGLSCRLSLAGQLCSMCLSYPLGTSRPAWTHPSLGNSRGGKATCPTEWLLLLSPCLYHICEWSFSPSESDNQTQSQRVGKSTLPLWGRIFKVTWRGAWREGKMRNWG